MTNEHFVELNTRLGSLRISLNADVGSLGEMGASMRVVPVEPHLPDGMTVASCRAVMVELVKLRPTDIVTIAVTLFANLSGHPCTGEYLEAQEWRNGTDLVVVGTADSEALRLRHPRAGFRDAGLFGYSPSMMKMTLTQLRLRGTLSLHFVVAENPDLEPADVAAWFAVDHLHENLLRIARPLSG